MDGFQTDDDEDDGDGSDKEMGIETEDGDEADSIRLRKLAEQVVYLKQLLKLILVFIEWNNSIPICFPTFGVIYFKNNGYR